MIEIIADFGDKEDKTIVLERKFVNAVVQKAIATIKKELPEEAQTVEVMECIISEINQAVKKRKIFL